MFLNHEILCDLFKSIRERTILLKFVPRLSHADERAGVLSARFNEQHSRKKWPCAVPGDVSAAAQSAICVGLYIALVDVTAIWATSHPHELTDGRTDGQTRRHIVVTAPLF